MPEGGIIAAFRTRPAAETLTEFDALYAEMSAIVSAMPGHLGHKVFTADDGELVVIAEWADRESFLAWDKHPDHERAKQLGKAGLLRQYDVAVGDIFEHHRKG
jgi:heme-degrading monooxygenase HmoA